MIAIFFSLWLGIFISPFVQHTEKNRIIIYQDKSYNTSFDVSEDFIGIYSGKKTGFLQLNANGTGVYQYDIFGFAPASCERGAIQIIWGFILGDDGNILKNKRDYGYSYPILMQSVGATSFQGCSKVVMKDFILKRGNELHVSSSDDWKKVVE